MGGKERLTILWKQFLRDVQIGLQTQHGRFSNFEILEKKKALDTSRFRYHQPNLFSQNVKITLSRKVKLCKNFSKAVSFLKSLNVNCTTVHRGKL